MNQTALDIEHKPGRFQARVDGQACVADYVMQGNTMVMTHTGVPPALEGRGIAAQLVGAAMAYARERGHKVNPACSYVAAYMRRHPETADLRA